MSDWYIPPLQSIFPSITWKHPHGHLALTFDDGPHPEATPAVLNLLKSEGIHATFFLLGQNVRAFPELVRRILDDGHVVGNHTFDHTPVWFKPRSFVQDQINRTQDVIHTAAGVTPAVFRPPYGRFDPSTAKIVRAAGLRTVLFSVNPWDFRAGEPASRIVASVGRRAHAGDIVVFHDNEGTKDRLREYLPQAVAILKETGIPFGTL